MRSASHRVDSAGTLLSLVPCKTRVGRLSRGSSSDQPPARVDPVTGYRWYRPEQVERARLVALLRRLDLPLARIGAVLALPEAAAADAVDEFWTGGSS
jgi:hypothetical protein